MKKETQHAELTDEMIAQMIQKIKTNPDPLQTKKFFCGMKFVTKPLMWMFFHTTVVGRERMNRHLPQIFVGNHLSWFDAVMILAEAKNQLHPLGKLELIRKKFPNWFLSHAGMIPVIREAADVDSIRTILKVLRAGENISLFPEGTRNRVDNRLQKTYGGASMFAVKAKVPVFPFAINVAERFCRRNFMVAGDPFTLDEFYGHINSESLSRADAIVRQRLIECKRMADCLGTLRGKPRRYLLSLLRNPALNFRDIYRSYEPKLLPLEASVMSEEEIATVKNVKPPKIRPQKPNVNRKLAKKTSF